MGIIEEAKMQARIEASAYDKEMKEQMKESDKAARKMEHFLQDNCFKTNGRVAYSKWLNGFLENGGKYSKASRHNTPDEFYILLKSSHIPDGYGAYSINVIVPEGLEVTYEPSHNNIYLMDGFKALTDFIPVYQDS